MARDAARATVAVFTRACEPGRAKSRLARSIGEHAALQAHRDLLMRTLAVVEECGLPAELWLDGDPLHMPVHRLVVHPQPPGDLGQRMLGVIRDVTRRGTAAIVVGSDCPVLDAEYVRSAATEFERGADVVIGPVDDGGYVLIGMAKPHAALFDDIPWSTPTVLARTLERARHLRLRVVTLRQLWDVDDEAGWTRWRAITPGR